MFLSRLTDAFYGLWLSFMGKELKMHRSRRKMLLSQAPCWADNSLWEAIYLNRNKHASGCQEPICSFIRLFSALLRTMCLIFPNASSPIRWAFPRVWINQNTRWERRHRSGLLTATRGAEGLEGLQGLLGSLHGGADSWPWNVARAWGLGNCSVGYFFPFKKVPSDPCRWVACDKSDAALDQGQQFVYVGWRGPGVRGR